jgi:hypothetical protein
MWQSGFSETNITWATPFGLNYYMAEESVFDEYAFVIDLFNSNLIINANWKNVHDAVAQKLIMDQFNAALDQFVQIRDALQQQNAAILASSPNYGGSSGSSGGSSSGSGYDTSVMGGWSNVIGEQSYYEGPDGGSVLLDSGDYHYTDGSSIYSSSEPLNIGGTNLSELTDLGTMGGD